MTFAPTELDYLVCWPNLDAASLLVPAKEFRCSCRLIWLAGGSRINLQIVAKRFRAHEPNQRQAARERALNPTLSAREVVRAREDAAENAFRRDRLTVAVSRLEERLAEVRKSEENERRWVTYNEAAAASASFSKCALDQAKTAWALPEAATEFD